MNIFICPCVVKTIADIYSTSCDNLTEWCLRVFFADAERAVLRWSIWWLWMTLVTHSVRVREHGKSFHMLSALCNGIESMTSILLWRSSLNLHCAGRKIIPGSENPKLIQLLSDLPGCVSANTTMARAFLALKSVSFHSDCKIFSPSLMLYSIHIQTVQTDWLKTLEPEMIYYWSFCRSGLASWFCLLWGCLAQTVLQISVHHQFVSFWGVSKFRAGMHIEKVQKYLLSSPFHNSSFFRRRSTQSGPLIQFQLCMK